MTLEIIRTSDGSDTIFHHELNQHFHSTFGAVQESRHIFIEAGFRHALEIVHPPEGDVPWCLNILEIGFGTGLNALMTHIEAEKLGVMVNYTAVEAFPIDESCWRRLNYPHIFDSFDHSQSFAKLHLSGWQKPEVISPCFTLHKVQQALEDYIPGRNSFDLVYFDAFGPDAQPELWTTEIFRHLFNALTSGGILVTYSVKGDVVRALKATGFSTEKLPGPPGKRHILRANKELYLTDVHDHPIE